MLRDITSFVLSLIKTYLFFFSFSVGKINHLRNALVGLTEFFIRDKTPYKFLEISRKEIKELVKLFSSPKRFGQKETKPNSPKVLHGPLDLKLISATHKLSEYCAIDIV